VLAYSEGDSAARGVFGRRPERDSRSVSEAGVPLLFPEDLHASSRRRIVVSVREARPMDLRTRPFYTVRSLRRLAQLPAPPACLEAPVPSTPPPAVAAAAQTPTPKSTQGVVVPDAARAAVPAATPHAPVRVLAKPTPMTPPPATTAAVTATDPATDPARPARLPTAPVKQGTAYDWTGLP